MNYDEISTRLLWNENCMNHDEISTRLFWCENCMNSASKPLSWVIRVAWRTINCRTRLDTSHLQTMHSQTSNNVWKICVTSFLPREQILHTLMVSNKLWNIKISSKPSRAEPGSILLTSKQFMICVTSYPQRATIYAHWWFPTKWETSPWIFWHQPQHSVQGHHQTHEWGRPGRPDVIHTLKLFEERECKITFSQWGEAGNLEMKHYLI